MKFSVVRFTTLPGLQVKELKGNMREVLANVAWRGRKNGENPNHVSRYSKGVLSKN
jgi:hypothetical protein